MLTERNCCYVAVCSAAQGASAPTGVEEGWGHIVAALRLQLVTLCIHSVRSFHIIHNVVDRGVLQAMWEELADKVGAP